MLLLIRMKLDEQGLVVHDFAEVPEHVRCLEFSLHKKDLPASLQALQTRDTIKYKLYMGQYHKRCDHHWRPEDMRRVGLGGGAFKGFNTGGLLWGERGCGKSQTLAYLTAWAHENSWINLTVASCPDWVENTSWIVERMENGLYLQNSLATRMLRDLWTQNEQAFSEMDVDLGLYGKVDMTGVHEDDDEPCPRVWDPVRQCWSDDWKNFLYEVEHKFYEQKYKKLAYSLGTRCPEPKKISDFIKVALEDEYLATNAIAELLLQVYSQDQRHVLVVLDGFNAWLRPTAFPSFRYANDKSLNSHIPPQDLALVRLFMKFDGHLLR